MPNVPGNPARRRRRRRFDEEILLASLERHRQSSARAPTICPAAAAVRGLGDLHVGRPLRRRVLAAGAVRPCCRGNRRLPCRPRASLPAAAAQWSSRRAPVPIAFGPPSPISRVAEGRAFESSIRRACRGRPPRRGGLRSEAQTRSLAARHGGPLEGLCPCVPGPPHAFVAVGRRDHVVNSPGHRGRCRMPSPRNIVVSAGAPVTLSSPRSPPTLGATPRRDFVVAGGGGVPPGDVGARPRPDQVVAELARSRRSPGPPNHSRPGVRGGRLRGGSDDLSSPVGNGALLLSTRGQGMGSRRGPPPAAPTRRIASSSGNQPSQERCVDDRS